MCCWCSMKSTVTHRLFSYVNCSWWCFGRLLLCFRRVVTADRSLWFSPHNYFFLSTSWESLAAKHRCVCVCVSICFRCFIIRVKMSEDTWASLLKNNSQKFRTMTIKKLLSKNFMFSIFLCFMWLLWQGMSRLWNLDNYCLWNDCN